MIEINLLPAEYRKKEKKEFKVPTLPYLRVLVGLLAFLVVVEILLSIAVVVVSFKSASIEQRHKSLASAEQQIQSIKGQAARFEGVRKELKEALKRPFYWTGLLNALSDAITDGVWLTHVSLEKKEFLPPPKPVAPASKDKEKDKSKKEKKPLPPKPQIKYYLIIKGSTPVTGKGTAAIGAFIQSLKENNTIKNLILNVKLEKIDRIEMEEGDYVFEFTIHCLFKPSLVNPRNFF